MARDVTRLWNKTTWCQQDKTQQTDLRSQPEAETGSIVTALQQD